MQVSISKQLLCHMSPFVHCRKPNTPRHTPIRLCDTPDFPKSWSGTLSRRGFWEKNLGPVKEWRFRTAKKERENRYLRWKKVLPSLTFERNCRLVVRFKWFAGSLTWFIDLQDQKPQKIVSSDCKIEKTTKKKASPVFISKLIFKQKDTKSHQQWNTKIIPQWR